jgi:phosphoglucomutase
MIGELREKVASLVGAPMAGTRVVTADDFQYTDPVDGSVSTKQGIRIVLADGSRVIGRLSGTGTEGATLRLYFERCRADGGEAIDKTLQPLVDVAGEVFQLRKKFSRDHPTVIT